MPKRPTGPHFARELTVSYRQHPANVLVDSKQIATAADAAAVVVPILRPQVQELFLCLHLCSKRRLLGVQEVARGGLNSVVVPIRAIVAACLAGNTAGVVLAHNHPSGDPNPSPDDLALTHRIKDALDLFEIELVDHIVIGAEAYVSFSETGRMRSY